MKTIPKKIKSKNSGIAKPKSKNAGKKIGKWKETRGQRLPDTKNVFEIVYRYGTPSTGVREFYLGGEDVKTYMSNLGSASIMGVVHGMTFKPLAWKVRKIK